MKIRLAIAALAPLALVACGSGEPAGPAPTVTVTTTVTATAAPEVVEGEPAVDATEEPSDDTGLIAAFGDVVTLPEDEGTIMISAPEPYTPSDTASVEGTWDEFVVMTVTETNDAAEPAMAGWSIQAATGDKEAEQVFDSANEVTSPMVDVMPGKSITYKIVFGRTKGADFVLSAAPLAGWNKAYFQ